MIHSHKHIHISGTCIIFVHLFKKIIRAKYCLFHTFVACSDEMLSQNPYSKVNEVMENNHSSSNSEVKAKPHNESDGLRENLQNDVVMAFCDTPESEGICPGIFLFF